MNKQMVNDLHTAVFLTTLRKSHTAEEPIFGLSVITFFTLKFLMQGRNGTGGAENSTASSEGY